MNKIKVIIVSCIFIIGFFFGMDKHSKMTIDMTIDNVEALAQGEISLAFCAMVEQKICMAWSDGMFIWGKHQY